MIRPVVLLSRSGVLRLRDGHPWIYPDHVEGGGPAEAGLVILEGPAGRRRGLAVWNPRSRIPLRLISREPQAELADDFWRERLDAAIAARQTRLAPGEGGCRWVHSEADGLPGLIVDRYGEVAVLQAGCQWADDVAPAVAAHLVAAHGLRGVLARHDGGFRRPEGLAEGVAVLAGDVPHAVRWQTAAPALMRQVDPWTGQKTGTYLDQRENQARAAVELPPGRILDAFCNDGGFALQLARAGRQVVALDGSEAALAALAINAELNGLRVGPLAEGGAIEARRANLFDDLRAQLEAGERYDGIVLDPPAMSPRKGARGDAQRGYKELNLRALRLLREGGRLLTCSCSFHVGPQEFLYALHDAAADAGKDVRVVAQRGAAACHPHRLAFPESAYLKVVLLEVTGSW
ncbi:MAG: class I SAM-dependent rRNA methyltransferase [Planctomycetota bacterium]